jgi:hypothetical protein
MAKNGSAGYIVVKAPPDYPGRTYWGLGYVQEHVLVWWQNTGQLPQRGEHVHHKNENPSDNRFENLELKSAAAHAREHRPPAAKQIMRCAWCQASFERTVRDVRAKKKAGQRKFFCCRSHQVSFQQRQLRRK